MQLSVYDKYLQVSALLYFYPHTCYPTPLISDSLTPNLFFFSRRLTCFWKKRKNAIRWQCLQI